MASSAPLFWGVLFGLPGIVGYKAVNTLDSMIGHRSERHEWFGWAAARIDDLANLVPARLTGLLFALVAARPVGRDLLHGQGRVPASLAQCGLAGSGDGRRARPASLRTALLSRRTCRRAVAQWECPRSHGRRYCERVEALFPAP